jgi:hypothetical protein
MQQSRFASATSLSFLRPADDVAASLPILQAWRSIEALARLWERTHVRGITEHFGQRRNRLDHLRTGAMLHALDPSAARTQSPMITPIIRVTTSTAMTGSSSTGPCGGLTPSNRQIERHFVGINVIAAVVKSGYVSTS